MNYEKYFFITFILLNLNLTGSVYAAFDPKWEPIHVKRLNDSVINAYLSRPDPVQNDDKVAIVLWLQGSGCDSVSEHMLPLKNMINKFKKDKFALLTAEKAGVQRGDSGENCTKEFERHDTIPQRIFDYSRILQHLRTTAKWWNQELYIIGASQGGAEAAILAAFIPETKKVAILVAGGGLSLREIKLMHVERNMRLQGFSQAEINIALQKLKKRYDEFKAYNSQDMSHIRTLNLLTDITIPIYMVAGTEDINDAVESARKTVDTFNSLGKTNLTYREYQGLDHLMVDSNGVSFFIDMISETLDWLLTD